MSWYPNDGQESLNTKEYKSKSIMNDFLDAMLI